MKKIGVSFLILIFLLSMSFTTQANLRENQENTILRNNVYSPTTYFDPQQVSDPLGVVIIDDSHNNDYTDGNMNIISQELESQGYFVEYTSTFESFEEAVYAANYLIISAPFIDLTSDEILSVNQWMSNGSRNLLLASRGDFSQPSYSSMNSLFANLNVTTRVQDDNVYTTDANAPQPWYVDSDNFNTADFPSIFSDVAPISFFSPGSINPGTSGEILVYAEAEAYQTNENGDIAEIIFDDTDDGTGGESIPLAVYEEFTLGDLTDRIVTVGTTLWSDFDYGAPNFGDITFLNNVLEFFRNETLAEAGEIDININDTRPPLVRITFPHNEATLTGTVEIQVESFDSLSNVSTEISIGDTLVSTTNTFTWDTTTYTDGEYSVNATAIDEAGNVMSTINTYYINQSHIPILSQSPKVMTYNIKQSGAFDAWINVLFEENADVIILVETGDFDDSNNQLLNEVLDELNAYFFDEIEYQGATLQNIANDFNGITLLSRFDIGSSTKLNQLTNDAGHTVNIPLPFLHSTISMFGEEINIIGAHLSCCSGQSNWDSRYDQQESIINYMDELGDVPIIYLGDMNAVSPIDVDANSQDPANDLGTEPIEMIIDASHSSASEVHSFTDVAVELNSEENSFIGSVLSRIDYIFTNQHFDGLWISSTTGDTPSAQIASDHLSVDVIFDLTGGFTYEPGVDSSSSPSDDLELHFGYFIAPSFIVIAIFVKRKPSIIN